MGVRMVWAAIDGANLEPWEQTILRKQMAAILNETSRPSTVTNLSADKVIEAARSFTDE